MCNCNGYCFDQLGVSYTFCISYSFAFDDCRYSSDHEMQTSDANRIVALTTCLVFLAVIFH